MHVTKLTVRSWHTDELHVAKLLAVKRTVLTVSKWPRAVVQLIKNRAISQSVFCYAFMEYNPNILMKFLFAP